MVGGIGVAGLAPGACAFCGRLNPPKSVLFFYSMVSNAKSWVAAAPRSEPRPAGFLLSFGFTKLWSHHTLNAHKCSDVAVCCFCYRRLMRPYTRRMHRAARACVRFIRPDRSWHPTTDHALLRCDVVSPTMVLKNLTEPEGLYHPVNDEGRVRSTTFRLATTIGCVRRLSSSGRSEPPPPSLPASPTRSSSRH